MTRANGKARWKCRRGMRELDVLLTRYLERHYAAADPVVQASFDDLLDLPDPEIFAYLLQREAPTDEHIGDIVRRILGDGDY